MNRYKYEVIVHRHAIATSTVCVSVCLWRAFTLFLIAKILPIQKHFKSIQNKVSKNPSNRRRCTYLEFMTTSSRIVAFVNIT